MKEKNSICKDIYFGPIWHDENDFIVFKAMTRVNSHLMITSMVSAFIRSYHETGGLYIRPR